MAYQDEITHMERGELEALQLERMKETLVNCYENIEFYKKSFDEAGFDPYAVESLEEIRKAPFTTKQDMRDAYPYKLFAVPREDGAGDSHVQRYDGRRDRLRLHRRRHPQSGVIASRAALGMPVATSMTSYMSATATACSPVAWARITVALPSGAETIPDVRGQHQAPD